MMQFSPRRRTQLAGAVALALGGASLSVHAQIEAPAVEDPSLQEMEEVVALGRTLSGAQSLINERMDDAVVVDMLGSEAISRMGDSTVASALRRIPGLSLVGNKFVYIRGLGERYSASSLNGSYIPSPDLTRNVIPLDIFPTAIVESLRVQKAYSPDMPANFGGGAVDVRTRGIPNQFTYLFELGSGFNTVTDGDILTYAGGGDDRFGTDDGSRALSQNLLNQINRFQGNTSVQGILNILQRENPGENVPVEQAQLVNREMGLELNRDIGLETRSSADPDLDLKGSIGNNFILDENWEVGFLVGGSYKNQWRNATTVSRSFRFPEIRTDTERETTRSVNISGNLNLGVRYGDDHELATATLFLRNTDDETAVRDFFNENRELPDGIGFRGYRFQFEEREMLVNQIQGTHRLGEATRDILPSGLLGLVGLLPMDTEFTWRYSDSEAQTSIPNEVNVAAQTETDPVTGEVLNSAVGLDVTAADYRFTDLDDEVRSNGWSVKLPFSTDRSYGDVSFGYAHDRKARFYRQSQFSLGPLSVADPADLRGPLDEVFSDENILNTDNNYIFNIQGTNNQSYLAATMVDGVFGNVDWTLDDKWRVAAGVRWEDYRQVGLDWNPFGFSQASPVLTTDPEVLERGTFQSDDLFPAVALTYMSDWLAETFQLRAGWSETTVRPDLREITDACYVDPETNITTCGDSSVVPASVSNFDLRAEWFFSGGDNFTATLFYKDIDKPIEFFEAAASDTTIAREIVNAESAELYGLELEGLKELGFLGSAMSQFFLRGNLTVQETELVAGEAADAPTNPVRSLAGASDYVANVALGFDSEDARHSASLGYNVYGERVFVAGRRGAPDGLEQPFHSVDFTYSWFPTDLITVKFKAQNILDDGIEIQRDGVITFSEEIGSSFALSLQWALQ